MAFDAVGELAATPGGRELSALVARAQRVDPEALLGMGRGLAAMAEGVDGSLRSIGRHGDDVRAAWQGRGADALAGYLDDVGAAGVRTLDATGRIRPRIQGAGQELAGMRREVDGHVSRALDAARRARAEALADPARAPFADQLVARAMAEPTAAARATVVRAETVLGDAATALRELAGDLSAFSRLPFPDVRPLAPAAGAGLLGGSVAGPAATVPAFSGGGTQGIDLAGGGGGDFTDTSSLDASGGGGCADSSDGGASGSEASGADDSSAGPAADLDDAGSDAGGASLSEASDSSSADDGFTGTSADLVDADAAASDDESDASISEASDASDPASGDDGFTGTSADLDDAGGDSSDTENASEDEASADVESGADASDQDDASVSEASDAGDLSGDADSRRAGTPDAADDATSGGDAGGSDGADATDEEPEDGAVTSASTGSGDAASTTDAGAGAATPVGGPKGEVGGWIREALAILQAEGVSVDKMDPDDIATIIDHESGGDPEAINNWDSNADKGTPSQGLMQTIGPTFDSYKLDGHGEITDPVDNIIAGVRYAIARYGSVSEVPGVEAVARGDSYVGY